RSTRLGRRQSPEQCSCKGPPANCCHCAAAVSVLNGRSIRRACAPSRFWMSKIQTTSMQLQLTRWGRIALTPAITPTGYLSLRRLRRLRLQQQQLRRLPLRPLRQRQPPRRRLRLRLPHPPPPPHLRPPPPPRPPLRRPPPPQPPPLPPPPPPRPP